MRFKKLVIYFTYKKKKKKKNFFIVLLNSYYFFVVERKKKLIKFNKMSEINSNKLNKKPPLPSKSNTITTSSPIVKNRLNQNSKSVKIDDKNDKTTTVLKKRHSLESLIDFCN
jgi:hypothetical protein